MIPGRVIRVWAILFWGFILSGNGCKNDDPNLQSARVDLLEIQRMIESFYQSTGRYPSPSEQLEVLSGTPPVEGWEGPFLSVSKLTDPWKNPYTYGQIQQILFVASNGPNGLPETTERELIQGLSHGDDLVLLMPNESNMGKP